MEDKAVWLALMFDVYGGLLTPRQQHIFDLYYNEDLSLGEIAENEGISRQAVLDCLAKARGTLESMEERVGYLRKREAALHCADRLCQLSASLPDGAELSEIAEKLRGEFGGL